MVETKEKTREEVIAEYVAGKRNAAKVGRKSKRLPDEDATVTINSLMDAMTIILVFLLMNYSIDPLKIDGGDDMQPPASTTITNPTPTPTVTVSGNSITVSDKEIVVFEKNDGLAEIPVRFLRDQRAEALEIMPLLEELKTIQQEQETVAQTLNQEFDPKLTIIAHGGVSYKLITQVIFTASKTKYQQYRFAVIKGGARGPDKR